ncbi:MAG: NUDIX domain-containing protein [Candidatus Micrarchaeota archaeon]
MTEERSSGIIVYREGAQRLYLLLHYEEGHWDFPKGHIEKGEDEKTAARRELEEETGIKGAGLLPRFKGRIEYYYMRDGRRMHKEVVFFLAKTETEAVRLSDEHIGYVWLPYIKALERLTFKNAKQLLEKAEKKLGA